MSWLFFLWDSVQAIMQCDLQTSVWRVNISLECTTPAKFATSFRQTSIYVKWVHELQLQCIQYMYKLRLFFGYRMQIKQKEKTIWRRLKDSKRYYGCEDVLIFIVPVYTQNQRAVKESSDKLLIEVQGLKVCTLPRTIPYISNYAYGPVKTVARPYLVKSDCCNRW